MNEFLLVEEDERAPQRLRQIALDTADSLIEALDGEKVHDARRRLKELRALTSILSRPKSESRLFRDAGRELSAARDTKAALEAFDHLRERFASEWTPRRFGKIRRALAARVDRSVEISDTLRTALVAERGQIAAWPVDEMRRDDLWKAFARGYRDARRAMRSAIDEGSAVAIHAWRKRVKTHWYQTQFLTTVGLSHLDERIEALRKLSRKLGNHHDLVLIDEICRTTPDLFGSPRYVREFQKFVARALTDLFADAEGLGKELFPQSTREWLRSVREEMPRRRMGPKKTPSRQRSDEAMLA